MKKVPIDISQATPAPRQGSPKRGGLESEKHVQRVLVQAVMERRLRPGAKLEEDVLSDVFNISRTRLRKVLSLLATELIVTHRPGYGTFVAKPSVAEARDVFEARHGIEDILVRLVCKRTPATDLAPLRQQIADEKRAHDRHMAGAIKLAGDFHLVLADLAGNSLLKIYMQQLVTRTILVQALYSSRHICLVNDHDEILEALIRRDADAAATLMSRHLRTIEDSCDLREMEEEAVDFRAIFRQA